MKRLPALPNSIRRPLMLATCATALFLFATVPASRAADEKLEPTPSSQPGYLTFEFNGGTLGQLLTQLRSQPDSAPNILADQSLLGVSVPPFSIRNARADSFVAGLGRLLESQQIRIESVSRSEGARAVFVVSTRSSKESEPKEFSCYSLADLDPTPGVDATVDAVRMAWKLDASHRDEDLRIQYHPATRVLLAHGNREALIVVERVVGTLLREAAARKTEAVEAKAAAAEAKAAKKLF